ncbi:MAG: VOC family protein [Phycisphaerales bacterium]
MTNPIPEGAEGVIPHLVVNNAAEAIEFYKKAFGAEEVMRHPVPGSDKLMHAQIKIGGSLIYLCDDFPEFCGGKERNPGALGGTPVTIHQYVRDTDAVVKRASDAGAKVTMPPADMFWGDRYATVQDPYGHAWSFATHIKDMTPAEMEKAAMAAFGG